MFSQLALQLTILTQVLPLSGLIGPLRFEFSAENTGRFSNQLPSVSEQVYRAPAPEKVGISLGMRTTAAAAVVYDPASQTVLFAKEMETVRSIASLTKFMSALVFLEQSPKLDQEIVMSEADMVAGGVRRLSPGDTALLSDIFASSLIASDNEATMALARSTGLPLSAFVEKMNQRAAALGLSHTKFVEPTGLEAGNVSTAYEVAQLLDFALNNAAIAELARLPEYSFDLRNTQKTIRFENTDQLIDSLLRIDGGKTGFTDEAGYCFGARLRDAGDRPIVTVILGSENAESRFQEVTALTYWAWENWRWPSV